jgi:hypothetical protein
MSMTEAALNELPPPRPVKETTIEICAMGLLGVFIVFFLCAAPGGSGGAARAFEMGAAAGTAVLDNIGWAFNAYVPVLLGFYAIVIGGQLVAEPAAAAQTRRTLGFVAEGMAGALVPAIALILVACAADLSRAGALVTILPVGAVMFFLSVQLGGFVVFERGLRLASASRSRVWAANRLRALPKRSGRALWQILTVNSLAAGLVATGVAAVGAGLTRQAATFGLLAAMIALALAFSGVSGTYAFYTARGRLALVVAWLLPIGMYLAVLTLIAEVMLAGGLVPGVSLIAVAATSALSALWPLRGSPQFLVTWSVRGGAVRYAARQLARTYARSVKEIRALTQKPSVAVKSRVRRPLSFDDEIGAALDALT